MDARVELAAAWERACHGARVKAICGLGDALAGVPVSAVTLARCETLDEVLSAAPGAPVNDPLFLKELLGPGWQAEPDDGEIVVKPFTPWQSIPPRKVISIGGMRCHAKGFLSMRGAAAGVGKTSLGAVEELSLAFGIDLLSPKMDGEYQPLKCGRQRVWCMSLEDGEDEHQRRVAGVLAHYGLEDRVGELAGRYLATYKNDSPVTLAMVQSGEFIVTPACDEIIAQVRARRIDVITVDPFVGSHLVPENDNGGMNAVADLWRTVAQTTGCAVMLTHHIRKQGGVGEVTADDLRGAGALVGAARLVSVLQPMSKDEAERFGIEPERRRFHVWVNPAAKSNITPPVEKRTWFHMASYDLDNGTDEWDADSVGVIEPWTPPAPLDGVTGGHVSRLAALLEDASDEFLLSKCRASQQATGWIGHLVGEVIGDTNAKKVASVIREWIKAGVLAEVQIKDETRKTRPCMALGKAAIQEDDF